MRTFFAADRTFCARARSAFCARADRLVKVACEDVGVADSAGICAVCHRSRIRGGRNAEGDVVICAQCQADAAQFIAIQDSIIEEARQLAAVRPDSVDEQHDEGPQG